MFIFCYFASSLLKMKEKIIGGSLQLYLKYGIKSITMDDVAKELGISKKTLYQFVNDKDDLVEKSTAFFIAVDKKNIQNVVKKHKQVVEQMAQLGSYCSNVLKNLNPSVIYDLRKYYSASWKNWINYKNTFFYDVIFNNIIRGVKQGVYRNDLNIDVITKFYIMQIEVIINDEVFSPMKYKFEEICKEFLRYHLHGICAPRGFKMIDSYIDNIYSK